MSTLIEFASLLAEYCLLPIFLFVITYMTERKEYDNKEPGYMVKIKTSGHEFVLIEAFVLLSIILRIFSDKEIHILSIKGDISTYPLIVCFLGAICLMIYMIFVFLNGFFLKGQGMTPTTIVFKKTYYNFFVAWWVSVFILGVYSGFFIRHYIVGFGCFVLALIFSYIKFNQVLFKYFLSGNILYKEFTALINASKFTSARKSGLQLFKKLNRFEGSEYHDRLMTITLDLGLSYFLENKLSTRKLLKGIDLMNNFAKHDAFLRSGEDPNEKQMFYVILAGLYYKLNDIDRAIEIINTHISEQRRQMYIDHVKNRTYHKMLKLR